jgi:hypothetical protein
MWELTSSFHGLAIRGREGTLVEEQSGPEMIEEVSDEKNNDCVIDYFHPVPGGKMDRETR